mmetsp:Transcript_15857/g.50446  ORF Transcript_15857/g.50446 Transcript_15857/m.50446 type:complete len:306 (-) Transcript_15857:86-1003(-)
MRRLSEVPPGVRRRVVGGRVVGGRGVGGLPARRRQVGLDGLVRRAPQHPLMPLDQVCERRRVRRHPRVLQELLGGRPLGRVALQAAAHKVVEAGRPAVALQRGRVLVGDKQKHLHRVDVGMRRLAHSHLDCGDAQRPDVGSAVVVLLLDHFGRHPKRGAHKRAALGHCGRDLPRHPKVCQLDGSVLPQQHVCRLDVAMDLTLRVQIVQTAQHVIDDRLDVLLAHVPGVHHVQDGAAPHVLHHDPELCPRHVRAVVSGHIRRVALSHHRNLLHNVVNLILRLIQVDNFDRDDFLRRPVDAAKHLAK